MNILEFKEVSKIYNSDNVGIHGLSFLVKEGEFVALSGPSGSGKTTALNIAAGLDDYSEGEVLLFEQSLNEMSSEAVLELRRSQVGFIFQSYNLFPVLTVLENIEYPLALKDVVQRERVWKAKAMLREVGLEGVENRMPGELSGGQQQRVAVARAMVTGPKIIFADEPTANLDARTAEKLLELFRNLNETNGTAFIFSSHDPRVLKLADRIIPLLDGKIMGGKIMGDGGQLH
ncbi:MAG: ABC transporter ATP-binding protein [Deltaproteobacteria bacterium]|nr:ABC transporter ATP-binding protein [Deltaproteobacteria bacterium]